MDQSEDKIQKAKWFEFFESGLYEIDRRLWMYQNDLATLREAVHQMRIALPADVGAYLHRSNDQTLHAHTDNTLNCDRSHAQSLVFAESSDTNGVTSELDKASTNNLNEITAHVTEPQHST
ncbi:hypothetical protein PtrCC142_011768, partial [Pyrenophora tritici-repentis]